MDQSATPPPQIAASALAARLRYVRWLGGGSGAGKSTIARQLASDYGMRLYSCDASIAANARRASPATAPLLQAFLAMDMDERWLNRTPEVMYQTFPWFHGEGFELIVEDLLALPEEPSIIVEGFRLLPRLVAPLLSQRIRPSGSSPRQRSASSPSIPVDSRGKSRTRRAIRNERSHIYCCAISSSPMRWPDSRALRISA